MLNQSYLTLEQIEKTGNKMISFSASKGLLITRYGKNTFNYWRSTDNCHTFVNYDCKTKY